MVTQKRDDLAKLLYFKVGSSGAKRLDDPHIEHVFALDSRYPQQATRYRAAADAVLEWIKEENHGNGRSKEEPDSADPQ